MPASLAKQKALRAKWPEILLLLAQGGPSSSLTAICKRKDMPSHNTVMQWLYKDMIGSGEMNEDYARARRMRAHSYEDEVLDIADQADHESSAGVNKARLQVDTRKWVMAKLYPKVYGDKLDVSGRVELASTIRIGALMAQQGRGVTDGLSALTPAQLGTAQVVTAEVVDSSREDCGKDEVDVAPDSSGGGESEEVET